MDSIKIDENHETNTQQQDQMTQQIEESIKLVDAENNGGESTMVCNMDGPYSNNWHLDKSFKLLTQEEGDPSTTVLNYMEKAKSVPQLMLYKEKRVNQEYNTLGEIAMNDRDTNVPGLSILDATYIKTPFNETNPAPKAQHAPFGLMIACDGYYMKDGLQEFWTMIIQQNVATITSVNEKFSKYSKTYFAIFQYFPAKEGEIIKIGENMVVTINETKTYQGQSMIVRYLTIRDKDSQKVVHSVEHIHFTKWNDFSTPANEAMDDLISILQRQSDMLLNEVSKLHRGETKNPKKVLIHCLAGRGRTGTAIAIINALITLHWQMINLPKQMDSITQENFQDNLNLSIFSIVRRLREQRRWAVQAPSQYQYIYKIVNACLQKFPELYKLPSQASNDSVALGHNGWQCNQQ